jgi:multidrug efflux pump subunit AcrB
MNIIKLFITRPTVVVVTFTLFVLFGLLSYSRLSQELFPKINSSANSRQHDLSRRGTV